MEKINQEVIAEIRNKLQTSVSLVEMLTEGKMIPEGFANLAKRDLEQIEELLSSLGGTTTHDESRFGEPISTYTCEQAKEDGILLDLTAVNKAWAKGLFNFATVNLLSRGYLDQERNINVPNVLDLLNQAKELVRKGTKDFAVLDMFFVGSIELPSGQRQEIFIQQNGTGKFTLMLPEDY